ncbi:MAG TPA: 16S rRNA (cytidine(1402)-2'-O)-methyltransferase [Candidatus Polarisedimenticolia bacterium]|nr:16S rRNA (cytidine(1402)-2'-O)-methyltransferase [Candidatus Polarisedimenticolia bacterium]
MSRGDASGPVPSEGAGGTRGVLRVVGTPIGHLEDLSPRAVATLRACALVACEDTRVTRVLLDRNGIDVPVVSCHRFNEHSRSERILRVLGAGRDVALTTDAGTPGLSDPGAAVVRAARAAGFAVSPIPGPSALAALWSVSGLEGPFTFIGFLPQRGGERRRALAALAAEARPLVFYESPHRLLAMLEDAEAVLGDRPAILGRELTKIHEEILAGRLSEIRGRLARGQVRGEITLLVGPAPVTAGAGGGAGPDDGADAEARLEAAAAEVTRQVAGGMDKGTAIKRVARDRGVPRRALYDLLVRMKKRDDD